MSFIKFKSKLAFTMAELMVVIFIVSIISAAALPTLTKRQTVTQGNSIPAGTIIIWYGSTLPSGFVICDGTNGTPDLREKFILGANQSGAADVQLDAFSTSSNTTLPVANIPAHTHSISVDDGTHIHTYTMPADPFHFHNASTSPSYPHAHDLTNIVYNDPGGAWQYVYAGAVSGLWHTTPVFCGTYASHWPESAHIHTITTSASTVTHNHGSPLTSTSTSAAHTHSFSVAAGGGTGASFNIMPPYYALYYIMKT